MSDAFVHAETPIPPTERRAYARQQIRTVAYIELDEGNGGIILNASEGGLAVQAVAGLMDDILPRMRFQPSGSPDWVETSARVTWAGKSRKQVGIEFVELPQQARQQIKEWLSREALPAPVDPNEGGADSGLTARNSQVAIRPRAPEETRPVAVEDEFFPVAEVKRQLEAPIIAEIGRQPATPVDMKHLTETHVVAETKRQPEAPVADIKLQPETAAAEIKDQREAEIIAEIKRQLETRIIPGIGRQSVVPIGEIKYQPDAPVAAEIKQQPETPVVTEIKRQPDPPIVADIKHQPDTPISAEIKYEPEAPIIAEIKRQLETRIIAGIGHQSETPVAKIKNQPEASIVTEIKREPEAPIIAEIPVATAAAITSPETPAAVPRGVTRPVAPIPTPSSLPSGDISMPDRTRELRFNLTYQRAELEPVTEKQYSPWTLAAFLGCLAICSLAAGWAAGQGALNKALERIYSIATFTRTANRETQPSTAGPIAPISEIEVVNLNNQRWTIPFNGALSPAAPAARATENPRGTTPIDVPQETSKSPMAFNTWVLSPPVRPGTPVSARGPENQPPPISSDAPLNAQNVLAASGPIGSGGLAPQSKLAVPQVRQSVGVVKQGELIHRVEPVYPTMAREQRIEGTVKLNITVGEDGSVRSVTFVSGPQLLLEAATDAVRQWHYAPTMLDGTPVESQREVSLVFHF